MKDKDRIWFLRTVIFLAIVLITFIFVLLFFNIAFGKKVLPSVYLGEHKMSGLTKDVLTTQLNDIFTQFENEPLTIQINDRVWIKKWQDFDLNFDPEKTANALYGVGRDNNIISNITEQFKLVLTPKKLSPSYSLDQAAKDRWISEIINQVNKKEKDASLFIEKSQVLTIQEEKGEIVEFLEIKQRIADKLQAVIEKPILLESQKRKPLISIEQTSEAQEKTREFLEKNFKLVFQDFVFNVESNVIGGWLEFAATKEGLEVQINQDKIKAYIKNLSLKIDRPSKDAKLKLADSRVEVFQPSQDGFKIDQEKTIKLIVSSFFEETSSIELPVDVKTAAVSTATVNDLGIKDLIGKATTSFKGSPENRIHNISVGSSLFNGILIKPGEVFSMNSVFGSDVTAEQGFLPELIIKEDRLIPAIGGGLCQVSTTFFRAALNAGLEIVERKNHSFRVRYYEPPVGMDATIFLPNIDLKFKNDTPGYILIQTKVEGNSLTFEFYGSQDGRKVEISQPRVFNIKQPGDPVYIDDPELPKGEVKQIERAVPGADALFTYKVRRGSEVLQDKTFKSHYVPWKAKFKVGTKEVSEEGALANPPSS